MKLVLQRINPELILTQASTEICAFFIVLAISAALINTLIQ
jgi:hypothetical protein